MLDLHLTVCTTARARACTDLQATIRSTNFACFRIWTTRTRLHGSLTKQVCFVSSTVCNYMNLPRDSYFVILSQANQCVSNYHRALLLYTVTFTVPMAILPYVRSLGCRTFDWVFVRCAWMRGTHETKPRPINASKQASRQCNHVQLSICAGFRQSDFAALFVAERLFAERGFLTWLHSESWGRA